MNSRVLFVSDLDGTLMRNNETLSGFTIRTINRLIRQGLAFTYATARSIESARTITEKLELTLPAVTRNGCVLADNSTGKHLEKALFSDDEVSLLKKLLPELPRYGFVSCFIGEEMIKTYLPGMHTPGFQKYLDKNRTDPCLCVAESFEDLFRGSPGYITLIDEKEKMAPIYERIRQYPYWEAFFQKDTYWEEYWLEICPKNRTKAKSILQLRQKYGFEKLVVFGDSANDLSMFQVADEAYAVRNALQELKDAATAVIGSNEEDAVAAFLQDWEKASESR